MEREKWEYWTGFLEADVNDPGAKEYLQNQWEMTNPPKYTPFALMPELNRMGESGWEIIHIEPVHAGKNADILVHVSGETSRMWSHTYFCVAKRRKLK
jgi:hypothetical protein